ncbi:MAG: hypothetical protein QF369_05100, partial [Dehalococcoidales bacterium]|nr:hypothetical protein [Dehalococcoidales bacterium]
RSTFSLIFAPVSLIRLTASSSILDPTIFRHYTSLVCTNAINFGNTESGNCFAIPPHTSERSPAQPWFPPTTDNLDTDQDEAG